MNDLTHTVAQPLGTPSRPVPLAAIPAEHKTRLLSGRTFWQTEELEEAGIRSVTLADGPYGLRHQSGPHDNLAIFAPAAAERLGATLGREAVAQGIDVVLGPGVNTMRLPQVHDHASGHPDLWSQRAPGRTRAPRVGN